MALVCASCQTDNRDGAKFCKGCGGRLMPADAASSREDAWPITQPMPMPSVPGPRAVQDETTVIVGALDRSSRPSQPSIPPASRDAAPRAPRPSRPPSAPSSQPARIAGQSRSRRRFGSLGVLVTVLLVAGGAWYAYSTRTVEPLMVARVRAPSLPVTAAVDAPQAAAPSVTPPVPASAPPVPVSAPDPAPTVAAPPQRAAAMLPPAAPPLIMQAPSAAAAPVAAAATAKPRQQPPPPVTPVAPASVAAPAPVAMAAAPAPSPAPSSDPVLPSNPDAACASQGFFGRSRCMVAQCARAEYRAHPQCGEVRRQQEIDEEKRNPTLAN